MRRSVWQLPLMAMFALLSIGACGSQSTVQVKPSPTPTLSGASVIVANQIWHMGGNLVISGSGFNSQAATKVMIVQNGKTYQLGDVRIKSDGSFSAQIYLPTTMASGKAGLEICSYDKGSKKLLGCVSQPLSLSS